VSARAATGWCSRCRQRSDGRVAALRVARQRAHGDDVQVPAEFAPGGLRYALRRRQQAVPQHGRLDLPNGRGRREQRCTGHELVQQHPERPHVGAAAGRQALQLFGRGVAGSEQLLPGEGQPTRARELGVVEQLGDAEVEQLRRAIRLDQHVGRLQVAMHDPVLVRGVDRVAHPGEQRETIPEGERAGDHVDRRSGHELHHQKGPSVLGRTCVQEARDARMVEPGEDALLAPEAAEDGVGLQTAMQDLDRHRELEPILPAHAAPHRAHATAADLLQMAIAADGLGLANHGVGEQAGRQGLRQELPRRGPGEQRTHLGEQGIVGATLAFEEAGLLVCRQRRSTLEQFLDPFGGHASAGAEGPPGPNSGPARQHERTWTRGRRQRPTKGDGQRPTSACGSVFKCAAWGCAGRSSAPRRSIRVRPARAPPARCAAGGHALRCRSRAGGHRPLRGPTG
jgi:hypothetical protein